SERRPIWSPIRPYSGITIVEVKIYEVMTQGMRSTPSSSPTIVGSAVDKTVWFSDASSMASINPINSSVICGAGLAGVRGLEAFVICVLVFAFKLIRDDGSRLRKACAPTLQRREA